jgi:hypothetical protein
LRFLYPSIDDDAYPPLGTPVAITPDGYRSDPMTGTLCRVDARDLSIRGEDPWLGEIVVHLPWIGYTVRPAAPAPRRLLLSAA